MADLPPVPRKRIGKREVYESRTLTSQRRLNYAWVLRSDAKPFTTGPANSSAITYLKLKQKMESPSLTYPKFKKNGIPKSEGSGLSLR